MLWKPNKTNLKRTLDAFKCRERQKIPKFPLLSISPIVSVCLARNDVDCRWELRTSINSEGRKEELNRRGFDSPLLRSAQFLKIIC